jgi:hypothetical protein
MMLAEVILRRQSWCVVALFFCFLPEVQAAFGALMPMAHSGQVAYRYGYVESEGSQSESTNLSVGWNATGFIWRPWFATTSMALNVGLSNTETRTSSSEGTVGTGSFSLGVFPRSRFPFSMSITRTDSRNEQFQDLAQSSGSASFRVTRLTLRQSYRPRTYNQLYNARYSNTEYDGGSFGSNSETYGLDYQLRVSHQSMSVSLAHSGTEVVGLAGESTSDVVSVGHVYTPNAELGVNSLVSHVQVAPVAGADSTDSQAFSSFFWRPEHRALNVSGGVRMAEAKSEGAGVDTVTRSLNTNLGLGYRVTRSLNVSANASVGTSDSGTAQTLSTAQSVNASYTGSQRQWRGITHVWNWGAGAGNSTSRTESGGVTTDSDRQNVSFSIGQNLNKSWTIGRSSSLAGGFSQSASASKNSDGDEVGKSISHGVNLSTSIRGRRGSSYLSARVNDSRSSGDTDTAFSSFTLNLSSDMAISRLSNMSGNANYQASQSESENELVGKTTSSSRTLNGSLDYNHARPFGIYNLRFAASLQGSKQIDSATPTTTIQARSTFDYTLGLLSTSLSFRVSESAGGNLSKSMNFQATRSF